MVAPRESAGLHRRRPHDTNGHLDHARRPVVAGRAVRRDRVRRGHARVLAGRSLGRVRLGRTRLPGGLRPGVPRPGRRMADLRRRRTRAGLVRGRTHAVLPVRRLDDVGRDRDRIRPDRGRPRPAVRHRFWAPAANATTTSPRTAGSSPSTVPVARPGGGRSGCCCPGRKCCGRRRPPLRNPLVDRPGRVPGRGPRRVASSWPRGRRPRRGDEPWSSDCRARSIVTSIASG